VGFEHPGRDYSRSDFRWGSQRVGSGFGFVGETGVVVAEAAEFVGVVGVAGIVAIEVAIVEWAIGVAIVEWAIVAELGY